MGAMVFISSLARPLQSGLTAMSSNLRPEKLKRDSHRVERLLPLNQILRVFHFGMEVFLRNWYLAGIWLMPLVLATTENAETSG